MKKLLIVLPAIMLMILLFGCSNPFDSENNKGNDDRTPQNSAVGDIEGKKVKLNLYFPSKDNSNIVVEEREIDVKDNAIMRAAVEALLKGPESENLRKPMPEGTNLLGIKREGNVAVVDFSKEYDNVNDIAELVEWISVVNTLTEIDGIDKVRILVEGEDLISPSGQPYGELSRVTLGDGIPLLNGEKQTITLYFSDSQAESVVPEKREVQLKMGESIEEVIFNELKKGPQSSNIDTVIPEGTRLISAETKDRVCTIDLSKEFVDNVYAGSAGEAMTLYSIINSLTELPGVDKVQFLIEGQKREVYLHVALDTPIERNEEIIKK